VLAVLFPPFLSVSQEDTPKHIVKDKILIIKMLDFKFMCIV
jgi:hypothetical protein